MAHFRGRHLAALAALTTLALPLAACGGVGSGGGEASAGDVGAEPTGTLSILGFGLPDEVATTRVDLFEGEYPDVDVKISEGAFDEQVFLSAVSAGNPPDLIQIPSGQIGSYAARGALQPLDDCVSARDLDLSQYRPEWKDTITFDDATYGIPEFYNTPVLVVNNTALAEAGLTLDDVSIGDQDKLMTLAQRLTATDASGKITRLGIALRIPELMPLYGYVDGSPWIAGAEDIRLDDPATIATVERLTAVQDAMGGQAVVEDTINSWDFWGEENPFATNQIGVQVIEQWYVNVLAKNSPDVDITVLPITGADGEPITQATGNIWAMPKGAKNPAAACQFMKTMTGVDAWRAAAEARIDLVTEEGTVFTGLYTGNLQADDMIFGELYPTAPTSPTFSAAVDAVRQGQASARVAPATGVGAQFTTAWQEAANAALKGEQSAADALAAAQQKVDDALAALGDR